jgi:hypothetical protein
MPARAFEVEKAGLIAESFGNSLPKHLTTLHSMIADIEGSNLPGLAALP